MACLRSFSRRSLYSKWFCYKTSRPVLHHHIQDFTESSFPDPTLLIRRFHRHVFFEDTTKMSFLQPMASSGVLLCRHMSSKPEQSCSKIDAFGNVIEELIPEKSVEAMATNLDECTAAIEKLSFPEDCVQYVINGIHEFTGFNWWMSIVLTTLLVYGLMSPFSLRLQRKAWELQILGKDIEKLEKIRQTVDPKALAKYRNCEAKLIQKFEEASLSFVTLTALHVFILISFFDGISVMAKTIPSFENGGILWFTDLSTSESFYLPLVTGFTFWLTSEVLSRNNLLSRMMKLPLFPIIFIVLQAIYNYQPALYFYLISFRIYTFTLFVMMRSKQRVKLRSSLGWPYVPVAVSEQQRVMARVIRLMIEFIDVVKKKDNK
ncbi:Mitochondrial inner membrane protein OXA1-like [Cardamine amara subsp. amara]|uniref:Mitochondrial inner membrane protein OXA1-like n=1 Tax=Cardamine amara subsp. amara TaxID=228776 RepID=A0ABD0ZVZ2_CARAN